MVEERQQGLTDMTDIEREAYRNEIDFLQMQVERYIEQNKELVKMIFKIIEKWEHLTGLSSPQ